MSIRKYLKNRLMIADLVSESPRQSACICDRLTIGIACCKSVLRTVVAAILRLFGNASFEKGGMEE